MGCPCEITMKVLVALGAWGAAHDHAPGVGVDGSDGAKWLRHFVEEETLVFPLFEEVDPETTRILKLDHEIFKAEIAAGGSISDQKRLIKHALLEDQLAKELVVRRIVEVDLSSTSPSPSPSTTGSFPKMRWGMWKPPNAFR